MKLAFLGTGDFGVGALEALHTSTHDVVCAVSQPDRPAGRGKKIQPTAIRAASARLGIAHHQAEDVNTPELIETLRAAELGVVVAFGQKLGPELLRALPRGFINIHGSLLPAYRGAAPFQWAVLNGERETGVTVFQLNEKWDAGAIYGTRRCAIREDQTASELHDELALLGADLIVEVVDQLAAGTATAQPQDAAKATRAPKLSKADSAIDWNRSARDVARWINGLWSWPAAAAVFARGERRERVQLARAISADESRSAEGGAAPGTLVDRDCVQAQPGVVRILEVKPAGGKLMSFDDFARGRGAQAGDRFLPLDEA